MTTFKRIIHQWSWLFLFSFIIAGLFSPVLGLAAVLCMLAPVITALFKGRMWCGSFCPRGSFNDVILAAFSRKLKLPVYFRTSWFRLLFLALLLGGFTVQILLARGSLAVIGQVFVRMILITTVLTIILGYIYQPRTWCMICPMGTMAHYAAKLKTGHFLKLLRKPHVVFKKEQCTGCRTCTRHCPIMIDVHQYKETGTVNHADCLKCNTCVAKCPKKSLHVA